MVAVLLVRLRKTRRRSRGASSYAADWREFELAIRLPCRYNGGMANVRVDGSLIHVETDLLKATIQTEGYVSGVKDGTLIDKKTGAHDLGYGLDIVDFLMEPGADEPGTPAALRYDFGNAWHGNIAKHYVALPQICTQAKKLDWETAQGDGWVAVRQWHTWDVARPPFKPGSKWEQWLVFQDGLRYFYASDAITSANDSKCLFMRLDMPGHLKHQKADNFTEVYLSYHGKIPASEFLEDFPPDAKFLYQRGKKRMPERMIRGYHIKNGPWLVGMTLDPASVYEAWCHQRGYICLIEEIGGVAVRAGHGFSAAYAVGFFDDVPAMERAYDRHKGATRVEVRDNHYKLKRS